MDSISLFYSQLRFSLPYSFGLVSYILFGKILRRNLKQPKRGLRLFENHAWSTLYSGKNGGGG